MCAWTPVSLDAVCPTRRRPLTLSRPNLPTSPTPAPPQIADALALRLARVSDAPLSVSALLVQIRVSVEDTDPSGFGTGAARPVYRVPITVTGALAAYDPLPLGAFDAAIKANNNAPPLVRMKFVSLGFDPYSSGAQAAADLVPGPRKAVARLRFTPVAPAAGGDLNLTALPRPVVFQLPAPDLVKSVPGDERWSTQAVCALWDQSLGAYSPAGCAAAPNPIPLGIASFWRPDFTAASGDISSAWKLVGTTADGQRLLDGCQELLIDCSKAADRTYAAYPDPTRPLLLSGAKCAQASGTLRVFSGPSCQLWQPGNAAGCFWRAARQPRPTRRARISVEGCRSAPSCEGPLVTPAFP